MDASSRLNEAKALLASGSYAQSEQAFRAFLDSNPDSAEARSGLGLAKLGQNEENEAFSILSDVAEKHPNISDAHYGLAVIAERQGRLEDALVSFSQSIALNPKHAASAKGRDRVKAALTNMRNNGARAAPRPQPSEMPAGPEEIGTISMLDVLRAGKLPEYQQAAVLMQKLEMEEHAPRVSAYLGSLLAMPLLGALLYFVAITLGVIR